MGPPGSRRTTGVTTAGADPASAALFVPAPASSAPESTGPVGTWTVRSKVSIAAMSFSFWARKVCMSKGPLDSSSIFGMSASASSRRSSPRYAWASVW